MVYRLVLMLDTALAYIFMLMFWRSHLLLDLLCLRLCVRLCAGENQPLIVIFGHVLAESNFFKSEALDVDSRLK